LFAVLLFPSLESHSNNTGTYYNFHKKQVYNRMIAKKTLNQVQKDAGHTKMSELNFDTPCNRLLVVLNAGKWGMAGKNPLGGIKICQLSLGATEKLLR
jgi:hypothetical protein